MSAGPVRRFVALAGLAGLAPTAYLLFAGSVSPEDAMVRALATLGAVEVVGRVADRSLNRLADVLESQGEPADEDHEEAPAAPAL